MLAQLQKVFINQQPARTARFWVRAANGHAKCTATEAASGSLLLASPLRRSTAAGLVIKLDKFPLRAHTGYSFRVDELTQATLSRHAQIKIRCHEAVSGAGRISSAIISGEGC